MALTDAEKARQTRYRERHREKCRAASAEWWAKNGKTYRADHRDHLLIGEAAWREANRDLTRARHAAWVATNPEKQKEFEAKYRAKHPERRKISVATYRATPKGKEKEKLSRAAWEAANQDRLNARAAMRRGAKMRATPAWISSSEIRPIYLAAAQLSRESGIAYHVDHIVPLKSDIVCGLHVPWNLQIIPGLENLSKGNRFWPDMP